MGEIDTKSIEPVQVALSFFGESGDQGKQKPAMSDVRSFGYSNHLFNFACLISNPDVQFCSF